MVTRNRRFPTPDGYSRRTEKRAAVRLVAEELEAGPNPSPHRRSDGAELRSNSHLAFELEPRVPVRTGLDLRVIERRRRRRGDDAPAAEPRADHPLLPLLRLLQRLWQRFCRWASWR